MSSPSRKKVFYVYALLDPRKPGPFYFGHWKFSHEPFYIGKGKGNRLNHHEKSDNRNNHRSNRIRSIHRDGFEVLKVKKRTGLTERQAHLLEIKLIKTIGRRDTRTGPLANHTDGGEGVSGHKHDSKAISKMMSAQQARWLDQSSIKVRKQFSKAMKRRSIELRAGKTKKEIDSWNQKISKGVEKYMNSLHLEERVRRSAIASCNATEYWASLKGNKRKTICENLSLAAKRFWGSLSSEERIRRASHLAEANRVFPKTTPKQLIAFVRKYPNCTVFDIADKFGYREVLNQVGGLKKLKAIAL